MAKNSVKGEAMKQNISDKILNKPGGAVNEHCTFECRTTAL